MKENYYLSEAETHDGYDFAPNPVRGKADFLIRRICVPRRDRIPGLVTMALLILDEYMVPVFDNGVHFPNSIPTGKNW